MELINELKEILKQTHARQRQLQQFSDEYSSYCSQAIAAFETPTAEPMKEVTDGDIVLLHPSLLSSGSRPVKAMVFSVTATAWENNHKEDCVVITPISPLSTPAFSWEFEIDEQTEKMVLQLWNTRCLPESLLKRCWKVGELSQDAVDDAFDVYEHLDRGKDLPERLQAKTLIKLSSEDSNSMIKDYYQREHALVDDLEL
jgi:hypothetical protein